MQTKILVISSVAVSLFVISPRVQGQISDDFSDLNDTANPAWTHLSAEAASTGQTWDASGANYRLQAPNNGYQGWGFVGSYVPTPFSGVQVQTDFVSFLGPGANPIFGVGARLNGAQGLGQLTGYAYVYEPFAASLAGEMVLYRIDVGGFGSDIGSQQVSLDPSKDYRFVLTVSGSSLHGQVFEVGAGMVAEKFATDAAYAGGFSGVLGFSKSGVTPPVDFTIDNFYTVPEPSVGFLGMGFLGLLAFRRFKKA